MTETPDQLKKEVKQILKELKPKRLFKEGDEVYFSAFHKSNKEKFYICKGKIVKVPADNERQSFKVQVTAVGLTSVTGESNPQLVQTDLLNNIITKQFKELHKEISPFMQPKGWIAIVS